MANTVTLFRVILALIVLFIIRINPYTNLIAIFLIILSMLLDIVDGALARRLNTSSLNGSIYDLLADRIIENIFFIYFASLSLFNVWFALVIMLRGLTIDAIRTLYTAKGKTAFGENTWHTNRWATALVCSKLSRGAYNTFKLLTFISFAAILEPEGYIFTLLNMKQLEIIAAIFLWATVSISLLRGIPVLLDAWLQKRASNR